MMKKVLYIFFLLVSTLHFGQGAANPFEDAENENSTLESKPVVESEPHSGTLDSGGGNPGDPLPIDDYMPLLVSTAVGIAIYAARQKKKSQA